MHCPVRENRGKRAKKYLGKPTATKRVKKPSGKRKRKKRTGQPADPW